MWRALWTHTHSTSSEQLLLLLKKCVCVPSVCAAVCACTYVSLLRYQGCLCGPAMWRKNSPLTFSCLHWFTESDWITSRSMNVSTVHSAAEEQSDDTVCAVLVNFTVIKGCFTSFNETSYNTMITSYCTHPGVFQSRKFQPQVGFCVVIFKLSSSIHFMNNSDQSDNIDYAGFWRLELISAERVRKAARKTVSLVVLKRPYSHVALSPAAILNWLTLLITYVPSGAHLLPGNVNTTQRFLHVVVPKLSWDGHKPGCFLCSSSNLWRCRNTTFRFIWSVSCHP